MWGPLTKRLNVAMMVVGFGFGQGALFLSQLDLVAGGKASLLGEFGICYTVFTLLYQVIDWGGLVVLARRAATSESDSEISKAFWSFSTFRLLIGLIVTTTIIAIYMNQNESFSSGFALACAPFLSLNAFNAGGVLDGKSRSGWTGLSSSIPIAAVAAALLLTSDLSPERCGLATGATFGLSYGVGILMQHLALRRGGIRLPPTPVQLKLVKSFARDGGAYLIAWTPGQIFYRAQLFIANATLGVAATGYIVFAKQIINGASQFLYFIRRTEFPGLVAARHAGRRDFATIFQTQRLCFLSSIALTLGIAATSPLLSELSNVDKQASIALLLFSLTVFTSNLFSTAQQVLVADSRNLLAGSIGVIGSAFALSASLFLTKGLGLAALPIVEALMQIVAAATVATFIAREAKLGNV